MASDLVAGTVVMVTGAGSGIGQAAALLLADQGAQVGVLDLAAGHAAQTAAAITSAGGQALALSTDMADFDAVAAARDALLQHFGRLDAWVNVAGGSGRSHGDGPAADCTEEGWDYTLDLNLKTAFHGCKAALQVMQPRRAGVIVNTASVLGLVGGDADFATHAYAASKGGIISLTRSIAAYYAPLGIRANVICPGLIATQMSRRAQSSEEIRARLPQLQPLTGDFGTPQDVAGAVLYLVSDLARFVTGTVLPVDGGWTVV